MSRNRGKRGRSTDRDFVAEPHGVTASDGSHRRRRRSDVGVINSNISEELDQGTGRSNRIRKVLEKRVERGGGEVERPA